MTQWGKLASTPPIYGLCWTESPSSQSKNTVSRSPKIPIEFKLSAAPWALQAGRRITILVRVIDLDCQEEMGLPLDNENGREYPLSCVWGLGHTTTQATERAEVVADAEGTQNSQ